MNCHCGEEIPSGRVTLGYDTCLEHGGQRRASPVEPTAPAGGWWSRRSPKPKSGWKKLKNRVRTGRASASDYQTYNREVRKPR